MTSRLRGRAGRVTQAQVWELAARLTDRDREIVVTLFEQRVLRTDQVAVLFFSSVRRAQDRMLFLYRHRVVDRFYPAAPRGQGKPQAHWLLDDAGAHIVAACLDVDRKALHWERRSNWGAHRHLAHRLGVNGFVTGLVAASLRDPGVGVARWHGPRAVARVIPGGLTEKPIPDAGFQLSTAEGRVECLLEWDRGTESASVLSEKLHRYRRASQDARGGPVANVLFVVPSEPRVETLHRALVDADQPSEWDRVREHWKDWPLLVTTTDELDDFGPLGRIWRPVNQSRRFLVALTDLPPHDETEDPVPLDDCLGRRWRKDNPEFWARLSPLTARR